MKPPEIQPPWDNEDLPLDPTRTQDVADDLVVHALLVGRFQDTPETASQRVQRVCAAFDRSVGATRWYWRAGLPTAAAAAILIGLALSFFPVQNVHAQLDRVLDTFDTGDKTYRIEIGEDPNQSGPEATKDRTRPLRRPTFKPARGQTLAKRLDGALLYIRNRQQVLTYTLSTGHKVARGFDGQQNWITGPRTRSNAFGDPTRPWRRLAAGSDPNLLHTEISDEGASLLSVDLRDLLHQIRRNYVVSRPCPSPARDGDTPVLYWVADRITGRTRLPRRIELWVEAQTGRLHDILCTGVRFHGSTRQYVYRITLVDVVPLSSDWFTPQAHLSDEQHE
jgi:hypothetical protein